MNDGNYKVREWESMLKYTYAEKFLKIDLITQFGITADRRKK